MRKATSAITLLCFLLCQAYHSNEKADISEIIKRMHQIMPTGWSLSICKNCAYQGAPYDEHRGLCMTFVEPHVPGGKPNMFWYSVTLMPEDYQEKPRPTSSSIPQSPPDRLIATCGGYKIYAQPRISDKEPWRNAKKQILAAICSSSHRSEEP